MHLFACVNKRKTDGGERVVCAFSNVLVGEEDDDGGNEEDDGERVEGDVDVLLAEERLDLAARGEVGPLHAGLGVREPLAGRLALLVRITWVNERVIRVVFARTIRVR